MMMVAQELLLDVPLMLGGRTDESVNRLLNGLYPILIIAIPQSLGACQISEYIATSVPQTMDIGPRSRCMSLGLQL